MNVSCDLLGDTVRVGTVWVGLAPLKFLWWDKVEDALLGTILLSRVRRGHISIEEVFAVNLAMTTGKKRISEYEVRTTQRAHFKL